MPLLRIIFFGQLLVMLPALFLFLGTAESLGTLYLLVLLTPVALATGIYALVQLRYPPRRPLALATLATPVVVMATPFLGLEPLPGPVLVAAALAAAAAGFIALLAGRRRWDNDRLFRASGFNRWLLIILGCCLLLLWLPPIAWLAFRDATQAVDGDALRVPVLSYFPVIATPALVVMAFSLLYAPVGMVRNPPARLLHIGQLALALLLLGTLGLVGVGLGLALINPG